MIASMMAQERSLHHDEVHDGFSKSEWCPWWLSERLLHHNGIHDGCSNSEWCPWCIGEQGVGLEGATPLWKKKNMTPPSLQNHPHPLRNGFWPPTPDFELFKLATFIFLEKKNLKEKKISPAGAGTSFCPKTPKSAIKKFCRPPSSPTLKNFFMTPPSKNFYDPPPAPKSLLTYVKNAHFIMMTPERLLLHGPWWLSERLLHHNDIHDGCSCSNSEWCPWWLSERLLHHNDIYDDRAFTSSW